MLILAAVVLTGATGLRGAEYDEQYTMFLTGGVARPIWPATPFTAGTVQTMQAGHAGLAAIARDLRATDVHPPLYFWAVAMWRRAVGGSLFAARLFSVLCGVGALAAVAVIAARAGIPPALAMLLTLGCYGFAYTSAIARGFALAQFLTLGGVAVLMTAHGRRGVAFAGGVLLGAATLANYLALFAVAAALAAPCTCVVRQERHPSSKNDAPPVTKQVGTARGPRRTRHADEGRHPRLALVRAAKAWMVGTRPAMTEETVGPVGHVLLRILGFSLFLPFDLWFFLAQRGSRVGQFPPFRVFDSVQRLARYSTANLFGGLPLYVPPPARSLLSAAVVALACALAVLVAIRWRRLGARSSRHGLALAAAAPPLGLLALGMAFHTTPIELRYLAFAAPFAAMLMAGALASLPRRAGFAAATIVLSVQAAAIAGLLVRPETMQPARATAAAASVLVQDGIVLVPRGNDGVGIVGAFAIESPPSLRLLVVDREDAPDRMLSRVGDSQRVVLALLAQDDASRATLAGMRATFANPCWRRGASGVNVVAFDRVCAVNKP